MEQKGKIGKKMTEESRVVSLKLNPNTAAPTVAVGVLKLGDQSL